MAQNTGKKSRIDLGTKHSKSTGTSPKPLEKAMLLEKLEHYLVYEKRYSKTNIKAQMQVASFLVNHYELSVIDQDKARMIEEDLRARCLKPTAIIRKLEALEHLAACQGILDNNGKPFKIPRPKLVKTQRKGLSIPEARSMIEAAPNTRDKAIVALALYTGLRSKEILNLNIEDLDLKNRLLWVKAPDGDIVKNYRERKAVMTRECATIVQEWVMIRQQDKDRALFQNTFGDRLTRSGLHKIIANTGRLAGIERNVYTHLCRHTCARSLLRAGIPLHEVMIQLGHTNLQSTAVYLSGSVDELKEDLDKVFVY